MDRALQWTKSPPIEGHRSNRRKDILLKGYSIQDAHVAATPRKCKTLPLPTKRVLDLIVLVQPDLEERLVRVSG